MRPDSGALRFRIACRILTSKSGVSVCTLTLRGIPIGVWSEATTLDEVFATNSGPTCVVKNAHSHRRFLVKEK